jgi:hypothetical protein
LVLDFTLNKYINLCEAYSKYQIYTVTDYLKRLPSEDFVIIRHDVDRMPKNALMMSKIEEKLGIRATYYFRYTKETFNRDIIKKIYDLGHEIGYHYETLSKSKGDQTESKMIFKRELDDFRKICDIKTVSMHGSPLSKYINDEIWVYSSFKEFDLLGDGSISISKIPYFTDAGRSWDNKNNLRDYIKTNNPTSYKIKVTDDLIKLLNKQCYKSIYINTHPERWSFSLLGWFSYLIRDTFVNIGKRVIKSGMQMV